MKKLLLLLTIISHFAFGQNNSPQYNSTAKTTTQSTGVTPKAKGWTLTDTSSGKSPVFKFETGRLKFKSLLVADDTSDFDKILVMKGDSLFQASKSLIGSSAIDTTKVGRIEQGRGTAPIFMYFNGVAWVRNDTSYVSQTGTNKFSGNFLSNQSFLQVGLSSANNTLTFADEVFTGIKSASATSETQISAYSTSNGYADISVYNPLGGLYDRRMVITGTGNNTPDQSFRIQNGLLYYFGNYTSQMTDDRTVPDIGKVKQLISDSVGTVQSTTLADGKIWIGDGTNTAFPRALSGDMTVSNLGVTSVNTINSITKSYFDPTSSIQTQLNSKQATIGLTTTGAIGAATYSNPTLNIPKGYDELSTLGTLLSYTGTQWNSSVGWNTASANTGTYTFGSSKLALSGAVGSGVFTSFIYNTANLGASSTYFSNLESHEMEYNISPTTTPSVSTHGLSLGIISGGSWIATDYVVNVDWTSTSFGTLRIYTRSGVGGGMVLLATSPMGIPTGAANDVFVLSIKVIKGTIVATLTCSTSSVSGNAGKISTVTGGTTTGNTYAYGMYQHGGTTDITSLTVKSNVPVGAEYLFVGNSITRSATALNINNSYHSQMSKFLKGRFIPQAGSGNVAADALTTISQTIALAPRNIFIEIGTNDRANGVSKTTFLTNLASIISALNGAGYTVGTNLFIYAILPRNSDVTGVTPSWNKSIDSVYHAGFIDISTSMQDPLNINNLNPVYDAGDQIHPNILGHLLMGNITYARFPNVFTQKDFARPSYFEVPFGRSSTTQMSIGGQTSTPTSAAVHTGLLFTSNYNTIGNLASGFVGKGTWLRNNFSGANNVPSIFGLHVQAVQAGTGTITSLGGGLIEAQIGTTGAITSVAGLVAGVSSTVTNSAATDTDIMISTTPASFTGTLTGTNLRMLRIQDPTASSNTYPLTATSIPNGTYTNTYAIYCEGGNSNFIGNSKVGIGSSSIPGAKLELTGTTEQLRIVYSGSNKTSFTVNSAGGLTVAPSNGVTTISGIGSGTEQLTISDASNSGAGSNIRLLGNGTNPAKTIRAYGGNFQLINNAYNNILLNVDNNGTTTFIAPIIIGAYTVATLPACTTGVYQRATVTDALAPVYDATVAGGGARVIEVLCNGTNWVCH